MNSTYYHTKNSVNEYLKAAEGFDGKKLIEKLKPFLQPKAKVLELGSGPGKDYEILSQDFKVIGSDYSKEFIKHLKANFPKGEFHHLDAANLEIEETFDGIYSNKVLHHLTDEELKNSLKKQSEILNQNGIICHSFWKGEGTETFNGMFVNYHEKEELMNLCNAFFEVLVIKEYKEFDEGDSLLLIAKRR